MANELRVRADGVAGALDASLSNSATSMSSPALADLPAIGSTQHVAITLFIRNSDGRVTSREVVYVTAHTASATTATIVRGQEGTTGIAWASGDKWSHGPTERDFIKRKITRYQPATSPTTTSTSRVAIDATNLAYLTHDAYVGDILRCYFKCRAANTNGGQVTGFDFEVDQPTSANVWLSDFPSTGYAAGAYHTPTTNYSTLVCLVASFTVTEDGNHGIRPGWITTAGTASIITGASQVPIEFVVENLGPESA